MNPNMQMEQFSLAYIRAVAAGAGYQMTRPEVDDDSIDGVLMAGFGRRARIELQAKATAQDLIRDDTIHFSLSVKNYNDLRADTQTPRILIVVLMPREEHLWVTQTEDELCLHHCAYWLSLEGRLPVPNTTSVTVHIPTIHIFDKLQLQELMTKAARGSRLC